MKRLKLFILLALITLMIPLEAFAQRYGFRNRRLTAVAVIADSGYIDVLSGAWAMDADTLTVGDLFIKDGSTQGRITINAANDRLDILNFTGGETFEYAITISDGGLILKEGTTSGTVDINASDYLLFRDFASYSYDNDVVIGTNVGLTIRMSPTSDLSDSALAFTTPKGVPTITGYAPDNDTSSFIWDTSDGVSLSGGVLKQHDGTEPTWDHSPTGLAVKGTEEHDGLVYFDENIRVADDKYVGVGLQADIIFMWDTNSANDDIGVQRFGESNGTNIPGMVTSDASWAPDGDSKFDDITEPFHGFVDDDADSYFRIGFIADDEPGVVTDGDPFIFNNNVTIDDGGLILKEGTTSGTIDINASDQVTLTGNDGAGVLIGADFAGIYTDSHAGAITVDIEDVFEQITAYDTDMPEVISNGAHGTDDITVGATGVYYVGFGLYGSVAGTNKDIAFNAFELAATSSALGFITNADPAVVSSVGHGFSAGNRVKIEGVGGATGVNDKIYLIPATAFTDSTFQLDADDGTDIDSSGFGAWSSAGTITLATKLLSVHAERRFAVNGDVGSVSPGPAYVSLTAGKTLEMWLKNESDNTNVTILGGQFSIRRVY